MKFLLFLIAGLVALQVALVAGRQADPEENVADVAVPDQPDDDTEGTLEDDTANETEGQIPKPFLVD